MTNTGTPIDETGTLIREGGAFLLQRDSGGRYTLQLGRMPVDHVQKRVRIIGVAIAPDLISVDGVSSA
ncbi:DUF5818 domain-containing protein [Sphingomonas aurantiaca]|jgi:hypothetical protein|uniref:DUF5818 domain-containing protein n=1 Tax=Sphingomonas TaxID=13687 RepID=UPI0007012398|nr:MULTISPECIES: DUF5818 domain-containing protein [Sphingomonas]KQN12133.1 hypothetical protein ASE79_08990 [Sphingomonas sp. Leaf28]RYD21863.1 MAG: hypothetical protein EOP89_13140 [Xanthomonadaceae bacterium]